MPAPASLPLIQAEFDMKVCSRLIIAHLSGFVRCSLHLTLQFKRHLICDTLWVGVRISRADQWRSSKMPETRPDSKSLRILVIDDEEHIRFALTMCLETDGHKVSAAGTIDEALDQTALHAFDLI